MEQDRANAAVPASVAAVLRPEPKNRETPPAHMLQTETQLAHFFNESLDLLCVAGMDGYFIRLSPSWQDRMGWTLEELQARPFLDFVHPDDREATLAQIDKRNETTEVILFENRYRHRDGSYRWLRWNARILPESQQIYASARDVTRQKLLEREILEVADREKERLGRELHDGLCQTLAGIAALSSTLSRTLSASSKSAAAEISQLLNDSIGEARDMARGLGPIGLDEVGIEGVLEELTLSIQHRFKISCTIEYARPSLMLCEGYGVHLYRIAQEAVNNAIVHGRANRIEISLGSKGGEGLLRIRDDGAGLSDEARSSGGAGLHTMAYRSRLIGGSLEVRQRTLRGTAVICSFPLCPCPVTRENPDHE